MEPFHGIPIVSASAGNDAHVAVHAAHPDLSRVSADIKANRLVLIRETSFEDAGALFLQLCEEYGIDESYVLQMQYVATTMTNRVPVDDIAVTVNDRGPLQIIQPHSEGDTTTQLDLFGLHCVENSARGGENVLSLVDQRADHSRLRAKEKVIVGSGLTSQQLHELRTGHFDASDVVASAPEGCRVLLETPFGKVVARPVSVAPAPSKITGEQLVTYWDNITVHDAAFHRHNYELLRHLGILHEGLGTGYEAYMGIESDSQWTPVNTDSGGIAETAALFRIHVVHKMQPGDFLVFNNRAWTHAVNNWPAGQKRQLTAMYA